MGGPQACTPTNEQGCILLRYLSRWNYISYHLHLNPIATSATYESEAHGSWSTVDHILGPSHKILSINKCYVGKDDPFNTSDHLLVSANLTLSLPRSRPPEPSHSAPQRPNWDKVSDNDIGHQCATIHLRSDMATPFPFPRAMIRI